METVPEILLDNEFTLELSDMLVKCINNFTPEQHNNSELILKCFSDFEKKYPEIYNVVYKSRTYDWYFGNALHFIINIVFAPELYLVTKPITDKMKAQFLHKFYKLLTEYKISVQSPDYYFQDVYEHILHIENKYGFDITYDTFFISFKMLAKYGKEITGVMEYFVSRYKKNYKIRKNAVLFIENYWFELIHNPYSKYGSRNIFNMSTEWNKLLKTVSKNNK